MQNGGCWSLGCASLTPGARCIQESSSRPRNICCAPVQRPWSTVFYLSSACLCRLAPTLTCPHQVRAQSLPASEAFDFCGFLADPATVRDWNIWGLPADAFSTENGVMVARGRRWPLMIDPQVRRAPCLVEGAQRAGPVC
jgi:hypothetical protein